MTLNVQRFSILALSLALTTSAAAVPQDVAEQFESDERPVELKPRALPIVPRLDDESTLIATVTDAYRVFERYANAAGDDISFDLSRFVTWRPDNFDQVPIMEVYTMRGGPSIYRVRRIKHTYDYATSTEQTRVTYDIRWQDLPQELPPDKALQAEQYSLQDVIDSAPAEYDQLIAITSYDVIVDYDGRQRKYRAAFFWKGSDDLINTMDVYDNVTGSVGIALAEGLPTLSRRPAQPPVETDAPSVPRQSIPRNKGFEPPPVCKPSEPADKFVTATANKIGQAGHIGDGGHRVSNSPLSRMECTCTLECGQTAALDLSGDNSVDYGALSDPTKCHRIAEPDMDESCYMNKPNAHLDPASCSYGLAAGWRSCKKNLIGLCSCSVSSVSIGYSGKGASASWNISALAPETHVLKTTPAIYCNKCKQEQPESPPGGLPPIPGTGETCPSCTPMIIDLDRRGFKLSGLDDSVDFDIDDDGRLEQIGWTAPESDDGFLALDKDGNGAIDSGRELFGDASGEFVGSGGTNGYTALALYDLPDFGGDGDGWITPRDEIFDSLLIWIDRSHDGRSDPEELMTLQTAGVRAIDLHYVESRRRDGFGNILRYAGLAILEGRKRTRTADVFFVAVDK